MMIRFELKESPELKPPGQPRAAMVHSLSASTLRLMDSVIGDAKCGQVGAPLDRAELVIHLE